MELFSMDLYLRLSTYPWCSQTCFPLLSLCFSPSSPPSLGRATRTTPHSCCILSPLNSAICKFSAFHAPRRAPRWRQQLLWLMLNPTSHLFLRGSLLSLSAGPSFPEFAEASFVVFQTSCRCSLAWLELVVVEKGFLDRPSAWPHCRRETRSMALGFAVPIPARRLLNEILASPIFAINFPCT